MESLHPEIGIEASFDATLNGLDVMGSDTHENPSVTDQLQGLANRINIIFIGIVSVVAYYFVILDNVPEVNYLTLVDAFVIATFLILAAGVILSLVMETLPQSRDVALGLKVDRICRWAFPLAYALIAAVLGSIFLYIL